MSEKRKRRRHKGLRKLCECKTSSWSTCSHPFHFNYKPRVGPLAGTPFRLSLDRYLNKHVDSKTAAESVAADEKSRCHPRFQLFEEPNECRIQLTSAALSHRGSLEESRPHFPGPRGPGPAATRCWECSVRREVRIAVGFRSPAQRG